MKPALAFRQPQLPSNWRSLPCGEQILASINEQLAPWWPRMFGYYLLKVGALSAAVSSEQTLVKHAISVGDKEHNVDIVGDIDDLPFSEHAVDVCLLNHCLEFSVDPHHLVREAHRVLIPNGYLIISGYNPISLAGLNKLIPYRRNQLPWQERFFTPMRVKDWLHLMGYEIVQDNRILHRTLTSNKTTGKIGAYWQNFAQQYLPALGSIYVIVAKKRTLPLTPIKPKWKVRPKFETVKIPSMNNINRHNN